MLHRVLARAARSFLLNDQPGGEPPALAGDPAAIGLARLPDGPHPHRRATDVGRIHQSRVSMRRSRSNLRTFRLVVDPQWGTCLRAELAWYTDVLGEARDLHVLRELLAISGPLVADEELIDPVLARLDDAIDVADARALEVQASERHERLAAAMVELWEGPPFTAKADRPAEKVLIPQLRQTWRDMRAAARVARKDSSDANLHLLRIRLKSLRYGCETASLVEGGPARKTAKAAESLQTRLGDVHDTAVAVGWLRGLGTDRPEMAPVVEKLVLLQEAAGTVARKGWRKDLKEVERRWRRWHP